MTEFLTDKVTMKKLPIDQYTLLPDININVKGYAIGLDLAESIPSETWEKCKELEGQ